MFLKAVMERMDLNGSGKLKANNKATGNQLSRQPVINIGGWPSVKGGRRPAMGLAHVRRGTREMWEQGHGLASVQEEVEAWASIRSKFSLRVVRLGLALERDLAHKCVEKYYFFYIYRSVSTAKLSYT